MKKVVAYFLAGFFLLTQTSCFGSFEMIKKVYNWNDSVSSSKFVKTLLFYVMNFIPIYGIAGFLDVVIFNLIEFWGGSNPIAMSEGEVEEEFITVNGQEYLVTATKNQFKFEKVNGDQIEEMGVLKFADDSNTWAYVKDGETTDLATINEDLSVTYYTNAGELNVDREALMAAPVNANLASK